MQTNVFEYEWSVSASMAQITSYSTRNFQFGIGPVELDWQIALRPNNGSKFLLSVDLLKMSRYNQEMDLLAGSELLLTFDYTKKKTKATYHISNSEGKLTYPNRSTVWEYSNFFSEPTGYNYSSSQSEPVTMKVYLKLTLKLSDKPTENEPIACSSTVVKAIPKTKLLEDFSCLLENHDYFDVILVAEETKFRVHKAVICSRSPVFQTMMAADMKEKHQNRVVIQDTGTDIVEAMLKFMYTGLLDDFGAIPGFYEDLYNVAEQYEIADLKELLISERLVKGISKENFAKRMLLADRFGHRILRDKCLDFIKENVGLLKATNAPFF